MLEVWVGFGAVLPRVSGSVADFTLFQSSSLIIQLWSEKWGGPRSRHPKVPRIEIPKASRGMRNAEGTHLTADYRVCGSG